MTPGESMGSSMNIFRNVIFFECCTGVGQAGVDILEHIPLLILHAVHVVAAVQSE